MVKPKRASKRIPTARRAKISRKTREHKRKLKKDSGPKKAKKDPGIPANIPFRQKIIAEVEMHKSAKAQEKKDRREAKKNLQFQSLEEFSHDATTRSDKFEKQVSEDALVGIFTLPDSSKRAYFKEFKKVVELSDVILVVLDSRDPQGSRVGLVEQMIREGIGSGVPKRLVLVLNKSDLVPEDVCQKWVSYLRNEYPTVALTSSKPHRASIYTPQSLVQLLKNYCRNKNIKTKITVGVIGYPNVGKSSLINSLKRGQRACGVGSVPGITQTVQVVNLDKNIQLLDSPGIVFSSSGTLSLLLQNCLRVEQVSDPLDAISLIYEKCPKDVLLSVYELSRDSFSDHLSFASAVARKLGRLEKGGIPDLISAAKKILMDWNSGKIPFYTLPPPATNFDEESFSIASEWSKEFCLDSLDDTSMDVSETA